MMPAYALSLFVAVPLLVAGALIAAPLRNRVRRPILFLALSALLLGAGWLVWTVRDGSVLAQGIGSWPAGVSIPFVGDTFSGLMLVVTSLLTLVCAAFAVQTGDQVSRFFAPLLLVLVAGVNGALLTADLFNMFVFIEVMLLPSYGLFVLARPGAGRQTQVRGVRLYLTVNLLTSTIFLSGVALVYGTAGTVNIAELQGAAAEDGLTAMAVAVCLFALGVKAAIVPVYGWLPSAYVQTTPAITALFSGLHTKVAIYAIYRIYAVVFDGDARYLWVGVLLFCLTMVLGVMGAVGQNTTRAILAFHMVSQIGYILLGVALFTELGLTAGIFYLLHHMIVKASLFLATGAIEVRYGTGTIGKVAGMAAPEPLLATAFFVAALSLAGIPPFSGFVAKFSLIVASLEAGQIAAVVVMILVSLITLLSMLKIWAGIFWGSPRGTAADPDLLAELEARSTAAAAARAEQRAATTTETARPRRATARTRTTVGFGLAAPALVLSLVTVALGLGGEVLLALSSTAAQGLLDPSAYVGAVLGR